MKNKMLYTDTICIDMDDTLVDYCGGIMNWHNETYGTHLERKDFTSYAFHKVWGGTEKEAIEKVRTFAQSENLIKLLPLEGAVDAVEHLLQRKKKLCITTSRSMKTKDATETLLDLYFKNKFSDIFYCAFPQRKRENGERTKVKICKELGASLIDDSLAHAIPCFHAGVGFILFGNYPWNQMNGSGKDIIRADNWEDLLTKIN
jgi:uncharacterized HAD superfamily protein